MMGLWADGWFYISSAGLLISGILFFFLLGQYRVASEAADATEEQAAEKEAPVPDAAVRPVYIPEEAPAAKVASHADEPEPKAAPKPKAEETPVERRRDPATSTGGISPAVVYLQNIKVELADLHKDLRALSKRVDDELSSVSTRDEALIERLGELTRAVESLKIAAAAPAAADEETAKPARKPRKAEPKPEPASEPVAETAEPAEAVAIEVLPPPPVDEPLPEPAAPAKTFSPDETIRMELGAIVAPPAAAPEPRAEAQPAQEAPPAEEKPRRGPVWPV